MKVKENAYLSHIEDLDVVSDSFLIKRECQHYPLCKMNKISPVLDHNPVKGLTLPMIM